MFSIYHVVTGRLLEHCARKTRGEVDTKAMLPSRIASPLLPCFLAYGHLQCRWLFGYRQPTFANWANLEEGSLAVVSNILGSLTPAWAYSSSISTSLSAQSHTTRTIKSSAFNSCIQKFLIIQSIILQVCNRLGHHSPAFVCEVDVLLLPGIFPFATLIAASLASLVNCFLFNVFASFADCSFL